MHIKQVRWKSKPPFSGIFTQQYLYQNYWSWTTAVEIIVGGCVVYFWNTVYSCSRTLKLSSASDLV